MYIKMFQLLRKPTRTYCNLDLVLLQYFLSNQITGTPIINQGIALITKVITPEKLSIITRPAFLIELKTGVKKHVQ